MKSHLYYYVKIVGNILSKMFQRKGVCCAKNINTIRLRQFLLFLICPTRDHLLYSVGLERI